VRVDFVPKKKRNIKVAKICINVAFCFVTLHQTLKYCAFLECTNMWQIDMNILEMQHMCVCVCILIFCTNSNNSNNNNVHKQTRKLFKQVASIFYYQQSPEISPEKSAIYKFSFRIFFFQMLNSSSQHMIEASVQNLELSSLHFMLSNATYLLV